MLVFYTHFSMQHFLGGDDDSQGAPIVTPDPDSPGAASGKYVHPEGVPGDDAVDNSQLGG